MRKGFFILFLLFLPKGAWCFDIFKSTSPAPGTYNKVLCANPSLGYLYDVCVSSPAAGSSTQIFASTFTNTSANHTGLIDGAAFGCVTFSAQLNNSQASGFQGMLYSQSGGAQFIYNFACQ